MMPAGERALVNDSQLETGRRTAVLTRFGQGMKRPDGYGEGGEAGDDDGDQERAPRGWPAGRTPPGRDDGRLS